MTIKREINGEIMEIELTKNEMNVAFCDVLFDGIQEYLKENGFVEEELS